MLIDWFTVLAQAVNFLVLVLLLRYLLYDRVMAAVERRESRIRDEIEEAERVRAEAEADEEKYRERLKTLEAEKERVMAEAREKAEQARREMTEQARSDVEVLEERWEAAFLREQETALSGIGKRVTDRVLATLGRILGDLAGRDLEDAAVDAFVRRAEDARTELWNKLGSSLADGEPLVVRSAAPIDEERKKRIREVLSSRLGRDPDDVAWRFETDPDLILGVEVRAGGIKLGWTANGYLRGLRLEAAEALEDAAPEDEAEGESGSSETEKPARMARDR